MIQRQDLTQRSGVEPPYFETGPPTGPRNGPARSAEEDIDAWLSVLARLLHLPEDDAQSICAELREHVGERVRDLTIAGVAESDAVRQSIGELGEAAELASRFHKADKHAQRRRIRMYLTTIGIGVAIVATGAVVLSTPQQAPLGVPFQATSTSADPPEVLEKRRVTIKSIMKLSEVLEVIDRQIDLKIVPRWHELAEVEITPDIQLNIEVTEMPIVEVLRLIPEAFEEHVQTAWRFHPERIEFGLRETFDRREIELVAYSIDGILIAGVRRDNVSMSEAATQLDELLHEMVSPYDWEDNGGSLAHLSIVGGKMFVEAPRRMHDRINWILNQLTADDEPVVETSLPASGALPETVDGLPSSREGSR